MARLYDSAWLSQVIDTFAAAVAEQPRMIIRSGTSPGKRLQTTRPGWAERCRRRRNGNSLRGGQTGANIRGVMRLRRASGRTILYAEMAAWSPSSPTMLERHPRVSTI